MTAPTYGDARKRQLKVWRCTECKWIGVRGLVLRHCPVCERKTVIPDRPPTAEPGQGRQ